MRVLLAVDDDSVLEDVMETLRWCVCFRAGDEVTVVYVSPDFGWSLRAHGVEECAEAVEREQDQKAERVLSAARGLLSGWTRAEYRHEQGHPATEILRAARQRKVDLIVLGARGTEERGFLVGSTAQKVKALADTNVLVVRRGRPRRATHSGRCWRLTGRRRAPARLRVSRGSCVRIERLSGSCTWSTFQPRSGIFMARRTHWTLRRSQALFGNRWMRLAGALDVLQTHRIAAITEVRRGHAAAEILSAAMACNAHLTVVGSRGVSAIRGLLLGSAAQRVIRHGTCSVLIGRPSVTTPPPAS